MTIAGKVAIVTLAAVALVAGGVLAFDIWKLESTAHKQMEEVLIGGTVKLFAEPTGPFDQSPATAPGYSPKMQDVPG